MIDDPEHWIGAVCPNCGQEATNTYDTGNSQVREFDCDNVRCRCMVFAAKAEEPTDTNQVQEDR